MTGSGLRFGRSEADYNQERESNCPITATLLIRPGDDLEATLDGLNQKLRMEKKPKLFTWNCMEGQV